jgi:transposase
MRGKGVAEDMAKTLGEAAHNSVGLDGDIGTKSELYVLPEEHLLWTLQLKAVNKVLEEIILKVPYVEKLLAIKRDLNHKRTIFKYSI